MFVHKRDPLEPRGGNETPESVYFNRRRWLQLAGLGVGAAGLAAGGYYGWRAWRGSDEEVLAAGQVQPLPDAPQPQQVEEISEDATSVQSYYPAPRDERYEYGRPETERVEAARYTNFYEFSSTKQVWRFVKRFRPYPWQIQITGLCRNEITLDIDEFYQQYAGDFRERQYRHRCVERWAMAIPWTGIPLSRLLLDADPLPQASHVMFTTFLRPEQAGLQRHEEYPWPYTEGLTMPEAMNELTFLATGIYGRPLLRQHGAPIRLVVPWKYGFKSIKSIVRVELTDVEPPTFWSTLSPDAYPFQANVEPDVPRPWPQNIERMLGTNEQYPTQLFNGYEEYVAHLYRT